MAKYYGTLSGQGQTDATKTGTAKTGIFCQLASWDQSLSLRIWHDPETKQDMFSLYKMPRKGKGQTKHLISGLL